MVFVYIIVQNALKKSFDAGKASLFTNINFTSQPKQRTMETVCLYINEFTTVNINSE